MSLASLAHANECLARPAVGPLVPQAVRGGVVGALPHHNLLNELVPRSPGLGWWQVVHGHGTHSGAVRKRARPLLGALAQLSIHVCACVASRAAARPAHLHAGPTFEPLTDVVSDLPRPLCRGLCRISRRRCARTSAAGGELGAQRGADDVFGERGVEPAVGPQAQRSETTMGTSLSGGREGCSAPRGCLAGRAPRRSGIAPHTSRRKPVPSAVVSHRKTMGARFPLLLPCYGAGIVAISVKPDHVRACPESLTNARQRFGKCVELPGNASFAVKLAADLQ
jgi:hypothetical protein